MPSVIRLRFGHAKVPRHVRRIAAERIGARQLKIAEAAQTLAALAGRIECDSRVVAPWRAAALGKPFPEFPADWWRPDCGEYARRKRRRSHPCEGC
jgi:hypothetical protein